MRNLKTALFASALFAVSSISLISLNAQEPDDELLGPPAPLSQPALETGPAPEDINAEEATPTLQPASPAPADGEDIKRLPDLSTEYLTDLLKLYDRLDNGQMTSAIIAELTKRDPEFQKTVEQAEESNVSVASMVSGSDEGSDEFEAPEPYATEQAKIDRLFVAQDYEGALDYLQRLQATTFKGKTFYFDLELGYAYSSVEQLDEAKAAMDRVLASVTSSAERKAEARKGLVEIGKQIDLRDAYVLLETRQRKEAMVSAEALNIKYPDDRDVLSFYAAAQVSVGNIEDALALLERLKQKEFAGESFPSQDALAEALYAVGRIDEAAAAYEELGLDPRATPRERFEAQRAARAIHERLSDRISTNIEAVSEGEGKGYLTRAEWASRINPEKDNWVGVRAHQNSVEIDKESRFIDANDAQQFGAMAYYRNYTDGHKFWEVRAGGGNYDELSFGATYGKERVNEWFHAYALGLDINRPSTDSLQLVAMNGTEDVIDFIVEGPTGLGRLQYSTGAYIRQVSVGDTSLGDGAGTFLELSNIIWENQLENAALTASYRFDYERFNSDSVSARERNRIGIDSEAFGDDPLVGDSLIESEYHPHGVYLTYDHEISQNFSYFVNTGIFYDFPDEQIDYQFIIGAELALTQNLDFTMEFAYFSDGTAASDGAGEVLVGMIGLQLYY